jgi:hypothetical protein
MRTRILFSLVVLLALLTAALGVPAPVRAINPPSCLLVDQQCVSCGRLCEKLCNYYECDDGSQRVFCGSCNCIEQCVVP